MRPTPFLDANLIYRGDGDQVGDLECRRTQRGEILAVFDLDDEERAKIAAGGRVELRIAAEPIPPVRLTVRAPVDFDDDVEILELDEPHPRGDQPPFTHAARLQVDDAAAHVGLTEDAANAARAGHQATRVTILKALLGAIADAR